MEDQTSIKQMIQSMSPDGAGVVEGTVTNAAPLEITLTNDAKMILSANSLIVLWNSGLILQNFSLRNRRADLRISSRFARRIQQCALCRRAEFLPIIKTATCLITK